MIKGENSRRFSWRNCSTRASRAMSWLLRRLRPRRGGGLAAPSVSTRRRLWLSLPLLFLAPLSRFAMSTSTSLPWRVGWSRHLSWWLGSPPARPWFVVADWDASCDEGDVPWGSAERLARRDSMYSFLND
nr:hypothetical protein [Trichoderma harzianum]